MVESPLLIFTVAFSTRMASALYILTRYFEPNLLFAQNEPSHIAAALASGHGFSSPYAGTPISPTAQQPPIYPLILGGIFKLFGIYTSESAWAAVLLNALAGAATALLLLRLGRTTFSSKVGLMAAWIWTLPWMYRSLAFSTSLNSFYLAALGLTAFLFFLLKVLHSDRSWFLLGMYSGFLALLQPAILEIIFLYGIWIGFRKGRYRGVTLACAGALIIITPWTVRNYMALGHFVPLRDNFGLELWVGNRPGMHGTADFAAPFPDHDSSEYARMGERAFMDEKLREAKAFIKADPFAFLWRTTQRVAEFGYVPYSRGYLVVSLAAWIGGLLAVRKNRTAWVLVAPLLIYPTVYYITHVFSSYRHPIEPIMILLVAYCISEIPLKWRTVRLRF
jgi:hypothetical protein